MCGEKFPDSETDETPYDGPVYGVFRGIEPSEDELFKEPKYIPAMPGEPSDKSENVVIPRMYSNAEMKKDGSGNYSGMEIGVKRRPDPWLVGFLLLVAFFLPQIGVVITVAWFLNGRFRGYAWAGALTTIISALLWAAIIMRDYYN